MTPNNEKQRAREILERLKAAYPHASYYLNFSSPLELLVATILSAQARDEAVNAVTAELFRKYKTAEDYANAPIAQLENDIRRINFYRNKAKAIQNACKILVERYNGKVPSALEELVKLPGIGRKTANAILTNAFGKIEGIVVDTHVIRLSQRMGFAREKKPEVIERDLMALFPKEAWKHLPWLMKEHGRAVCTPKKPKCDSCVVNDLCPKVGV
jgi:endonuclease-3